MLRLAVLFLILGLASPTNGHGYMKDPPARNSMWRYGFRNPVNYNDNENFCGGAFYQFDQGGKCGVCGDPYGKPQPHADGGSYANGIIARNYKKNQIINVEVILTTPHYGYFEFRIGQKAVGDHLGKLQGHLLELVGGGTRFKIIYDYKNGQQTINVSLKLPLDFTCKTCVIQWWYKGGNNWGCDGSVCGMGYGAQEHFVNCADVSVQ